MKNKFFQPYRYDIALQDGVGANLVAYVTGLMVFFVTLALAVNFALTTVTHNWVSGLSGSLTVEIKPPAVSQGAGLTAAQRKSFEESVDKVLWLAKQHPAVADSRRLSDDEIRALISPWLGDKTASEIALPALVDIKLAPDADTAQLQADIVKLVPAATVDSHADTLDDVQTLVNTARSFVLMLTAVITALAVVAIAGMVRSKFAIHHQEVETLHLIGASDEYIARQFRQHTLRGTMKGALIGLAAMLASIGVISMVTGTLDSTVMPQVTLQPLHWLVVVVSPVIIGAGIAHVTAHKTVMGALARMS